MDIGRFYNNLLIFAGGDMFLFDLRQMPLYPPSRKVTLLFLPHSDQAFQQYRLFSCKCQRSSIRIKAFFYYRFLPSLICPYIKILGTPLSACSPISIKLNIFIKLLFRGSDFPPRRICSFPNLI